MQNKQAGTLRLKRVKRKGYFYILKYGNNYKYGATTRDVNQRRRCAKIKKGLNYKIVYTKLCKDVFAFENKYKYKILNNRFIERDLDSCEFFKTRLHFIDLIMLAEEI